MWVCASKFYRDVYTTFLFLPLWGLGNHPPPLAVFTLWKKNSFVPFIWDHMWNRNTHHKSELWVKITFWLGYFSILFSYQSLKWQIFPKQDGVVRLPQLWVAEVSVIWVSQILPGVFLYHAMILKLDICQMASSRMFH